MVNLIIILLLRRRPTTTTTRRRRLAAAAAATDNEGVGRRGAWASSLLVGNNRWCPPFLSRRLLLCSRQHYFSSASLTVSLSLLGSSSYLCRPRSSFVFSSYSCSTAVAGRRLSAVAASSHSRRLPDERGALKLPTVFYLSCCGVASPRCAPLGTMHRRPQLPKHRPAAWEIHAHHQDGGRLPQDTAATPLPKR